MAGNWKMHMLAEDGCRLAQEVAGYCSADQGDREVLLAPPFTILKEVAETVKSSSILLAGQNVCWEEKGAFTAEIAPGMIQDCGGVAAIVGHSERRQIFGETDELINKRVLGGLRSNLLVILCVGESLQEREENRTFDVLRTQVEKGLAGVESSAMMKVVVAYEPVWAIGTGKTATKEQAQEAHAFIRELLEQMYEKNVAEQTRILYGGSVKPTNVDELMAQPDIDGALVGGAALDSESFGRIIQFQKA